MTGSARLLRVFLAAALVLAGGCAASGTAGALTTQPGAAQVAQCDSDPDTPKRQFRAMWIASVNNLDWPSAPGLSPATQRAQLRQWFDRAEALRMNAVVVQVRPNADAFWPSPYEPWSRWLTGTQGGNPGYDPLAFMVSEAHARNLELHAWFNPYRVGSASHLHPSHPARQHPDWVFSYDGQLVYDPGVPAVRTHVSRRLRHRGRGAHLQLCTALLTPERGDPSMSNESEPRLSRRAVMRGAVMLGVGAGIGVPMLSSTPAGAQVTSPTIYSRSAWGARPPRGTVNIIGNRPNKLIIHHTASANQSNTSQAAAFALSRSIQSYHMDSNGWIDAGQQYTISRGGYIMEGRSQSLPTLRGGTSFPQGAHVSGQNTQAVGIENEGTYTSVGPPAALWNSMVRMCAYICSQYAIPVSQIYGHRDFNATACPGNVLYSRLPQLRSEVAALLNGGGGDFSVVVDNTTSGRFTASGNWGTSSFSSDRYGADYKFADPVLASDPAWYRVNIPSSGTYLVDAWWPANSGYNNSTPYVVVTSSGSQTVNVSQRSDGGRWVNLGSFSLAAGDYNVVGVSRWTSGTGYVIADAIRIRN